MISGRREKLAALIYSVAFNAAERWSEDVSEDVAHEIRRRCDLQVCDLPSTISNFVEGHEGHD